jgi:AraC-like DNA-binding protein
MHFIKYMRFKYSILAVKYLLERHSMSYRLVQMGFVDFDVDPDPLKFSLFKDDLLQYQLEYYFVSTSPLVDNALIALEEMFDLSIKGKLVWDKNKKVSSHIVEYLCDKLKCGTITLCRNFKSEMKETLKHYHVLRRIERAIDLLSMRMPLKEVARLLDYSDPDEMYKQFHLYKGCAPSDFQKCSDGPTENE